jgi:hypothetical protein
MFLWIVIHMHPGTLMKHVSLPNVFIAFLAIIPWPHPWHDDVPGCIISTGSILGVGTGLLI